MSELHQALGEIRTIRRQLARSTEFRGYGPATLAATGVGALLAATLQARLVPEPATHLQAYLLLWVGTAVLGSSLAGWQIHRRTRRLHSVLSGEMIRLAVEQFLPAAVCGMLLTAVLSWRMPAEAHLLPGLWQILFGLGVFSSCRFLPRTMALAGAWYAVCGLLVLTLADGQALAPWSMGLGFGVGQLLVAAVLWLQGPGEGAR